MVKGLTTMLEILNSIPRSHMVQRENQSPLSSTCVETHTEYISKYTRNNWFKKTER